MATNITAITATAVSSKQEQSKQFQGLFSVIPFIVSLEDDSVAAQVAGQVEITVPGAAFGDFVLIAAPLDLTGCVIVGQVSAANKVKITTWNVEGTDANTTLANATVTRGLVLKTRADVWAAPAV